MSFFYNYEYIVPMDDLYVKPILYEPRLRSIEYKSKCSVKISRRLLNRQVGTSTWIKFIIIKIRGPSESSVIKCNNLLKALIPYYIYRKEYENDITPTLYTSEFFPDNTNLVHAFQRLGATQDTYQGLQLHSGHSKRNRYPNLIGTDGTPWKINIPEKKGIHYPSQQEAQTFVNYYQHDLYSTQKPIAHYIGRCPLNIKEKDIKRITTGSTPKKVANETFDCGQKITVSNIVPVTKKLSLTKKDIKVIPPAASFNNDSSPKIEDSPLKSDVKSSIESLDVNEKKNLSFDEISVSVIKRVSLTKKDIKVISPAASFNNYSSPKIKDSSLKSDVKSSIENLDVKEKKNLSFDEISGSVIKRVSLTKKDIELRVQTTSFQNDSSPKTQENPFINDIESSNDDFDFTKKNNVRFDEFDFTKKYKGSSQDFDVSNDFNISYKETNIKKEVHPTFQEPLAQNFVIAKNNRKSPVKTKIIVVESQSIIEYDENLTPKISLISDITKKASNLPTEEPEDEDNQYAKQLERSFT